jgi:hypothetical protein
MTSFLDSNAMEQRLSSTTSAGPPPLLGHFGIFGRCDVVVEAAVAIPIQWIVGVFTKRRDGMRQEVRDIDLSVLSSTINHLTPFLGFLATFCVF